MRPLKIVLTGSECTGKTTLARALAARQDTAVVPEFALRLAQGVVILDTDLVSTVLYARHYYGACPSWIEQEAWARRGDLYLLNHPDVAWVADGLQRDRGAARAVMHDLFGRTLREFVLPVANVAGPWPERWQTATAAVDALINKDRTSPGRTKGLRSA